MLVKFLVIKNLENIKNGLTFYFEFCVFKSFNKHTSFDFMSLRLRGGPFSEIVIFSPDPVTLSFFSKCDLSLIRIYKCL